MSVHRTAMGKAVDMAALAAQNEKTRAVGNMNVNARGDILDSQNKVIQDNTKRVKASYAKTVIQPKNQQPRQQPQAVQPSRSELTKEEQMFEDDDDDFVK